MAVCTIYPSMGATDESNWMIEVDDEAYNAIKAAVEVAYDDPDSVPDEFKSAGAMLWQTFAAGTPG